MVHFQERKRDGSQLGSEGGRRRAQLNHERAVTKVVESPHLCCVLELVLKLPSGINTYL